MSAVTASVAPSASAPESPMKIWAGWTLNHRKPEQRADDQRAQEREVGLGRVVEQRDEHVRDEGDGDRAARQPVEPVGEVHAVGRGDDREGAEQDVEPRLDRDRPDERHGDGGDVVRLLDLPGRDERDDRQPDELLAGADPLPGPRVQVVVEGAQHADAGQRRERRERRGVRLLRRKK